jgi:hypothetical protein
MEYESVNNPFITLRNLSTDNAESFTSALGKLPPNLDNISELSNLKKSKSELYTDNRAYKLKETDPSPFDNYSITLLDIDNILYEYFVKIIKPEVVDVGGTLVSVPVRHVSPERWSSIQSDGFIRDNKGQVQRPIIVFIRTSVSKDENFAHLGKYLSVPFIKKFDSKNMYDRFSLIHDVKKVYEVHNVTFPDHVVLNYDFTMSTEYVEQMNTLVEKINFASNDYWGDPNGFKFRTKIDSFNNSVEMADGEDRNVTTTFSATVNAYLLPEIFDNKKTSTKSLTARKIVWGVEYNMNGDSFAGELPGDKQEIKNITLDRKRNEAYISNNRSYELRINIDEEFYLLETENQFFKIKYEVNEDANEFFIFDYMGENETILSPNETYEKLLEDGSRLNIKVHKSCANIISVAHSSV